MENNPIFSDEWESAIAKEIASLKLSHVFSNFFSTMARGETITNGLADRIHQINHAPLILGNISAHAKIRDGLLHAALFGISAPLTTITVGEEQPTFEDAEENSTFLPLYGVSIPINHSRLRHSIITQGKLIFDDFMNGNFLRNFQEIRQTVTIADAFSNMDDKFIVWPSEEVSNFLCQFITLGCKNLFMDFEGDEGNTIILAYSAANPHASELAGDNDPYINKLHLCICDTNDPSWKENARKDFVTILTDFEKNKYYLDDPQRSDLRRIAHISHRTLKTTTENFTLTLQENAERMHIFGLTGHFHFPFAHHPGLSDLCCFFGIACHKIKMTPTEISQWNSHRPLFEHPDLYEYALSEAKAHAVVMELTIEHVEFPYVPINQRRSPPETILYGTPVEEIFPHTFDDPVSTLQCIIDNKHATHITRENPNSKNPLGDISTIADGFVSSSLSFRCNGINITTHPTFQRNADRLEKDFDHRQATITYNIEDVLGHPDSHIITLRLKIIEDKTSMSWKRLRAILAMFCLNQLMCTSHQLRHLLQQMHPNIPIMI